MDTYNKLNELTEQRNELRDGLRKSAELHAYNVEGSANQRANSVEERETQCVNGMQESVRSHPYNVNGSKKSRVDNVQGYKGLYADGLQESIEPHSYNVDEIAKSIADSVQEREVVKETVEEKVQEEEKERHIRRTVRERTTKLLIGLGMPLSIRGSRFIITAVQEVVSNSKIIDRMTKELYPTVARLHDVTASSVERAIRHAVEVAWARGRFDVINAFIDENLFDADNQPTNGEFIALVADTIAMQLDLLD